MMLKTIDDVRRYTDDLAKQFPAIANGIKLSRRVAPLSDKLVSDLHLPPKYRTIAESNALAGVSIGYFGLWPTAVEEPLCQSLVRANGPDALIRMTQFDDLIAVANFEANPICVSSTASDKPDQVFFLETMASPAWTLEPIADDFEQFLILAANIYYISFSREADVKDGTEYMSRCCLALGCNGAEAEYWKKLIADLVD